MDWTQFEDHHLLLEEVEEEEKEEVLMQAHLSELFVIVDVSLIHQSNSTRDHVPVSR